ncbi:ABC transporter permease [Neobacillus massiliamazoniensis]|jgi:putative ABC transport system permease protein|uniref:ABC transporter permease n=1 Tax=Neobacillus massiliamazoniensis TaxID=1499688 RepID=A0A0U1P0G4_9BACI|nr:ABC transporter permease [Neobacillus massiliamazoniensis]CRK83711.1 ABC transporter permease [Neobacillus massiliamazoniensis]
MFTAIFGSFEAGIIYAIMALGVYLSFRILDFPDLTVDGSFVTGAAISAVLIAGGANPFIATLAALFAGFAAGCLTGILHTIGKINNLLSGILMMIALYSINLRIMGKSNIPLLNTDTAFTKISAVFEKTGADAFLNRILTSIGLGDSLPDTWGILISMIVVTFVIKWITDLFLLTEVGLAIRAIGDNKRMIRSLSANTNLLIILGLGLSNALVAFSGALIAQESGFADIGMGIGMIIIGLASVIIGEALFGTKTIRRTTLAVIGGSIVYRIVVTLALRIEFLKPGDLKLITAIMVVLALTVPIIIERSKEKKRKAKRIREKVLTFDASIERKGETHAAIKSDS